LSFRVLLVDDDADLLEAFALALTHLGFSVTTAQSVQDATAKLKSATGERAVQAVVTDLALQDVGGLAFCEALSKQYPGLPVVVLTGHDEAGRAAHRLGAVAVLVKPIEASELAAALHRVLSGSG
jgi:two-component system response regulator GlrR